MIAPRTRSPYPSNVSLSKLLLVEGETPAHFFEAFAVSLGLDKIIEIRNFGGNQLLVHSLTALVQSHGFANTVQSLGIARDAEVDAQAAKRSVEGAIQQAKCPQQIKRSILILPNNANPGMLETLCLESVSQVSHFPAVERFIQDAISLGAQFPGGLAIVKSRLQVFMAAHEKPQIHPGIAASRGFWPFSHQCFSHVRTFLQSL